MLGNTVHGGAGSYTPGSSFSETHNRAERTSTRFAAFVLTNHTVTPISIATDAQIVPHACVSSIVMCIDRSDTPQLKKGAIQ